MQILTIKETYPYITNMLKFAKKYDFDIKECYNDEDIKKCKYPKFCKYNNNKTVYMTRDIMDSLAETKKEKQELYDYLLESFDKGLDLDVIPEEEFFGETDLDPIVQAQKNVYKLLSQKF